MFHYRLTQHARLMIVDRGIDLGWVERVINNPARTERDKTDRQLAHALGRIQEHDYRVLRVIYNDSTLPWLIVTAYFDRAMRDKL